LRLVSEGLPQTKKLAIRKGSDDSEVTLATGILNSTV
jgi:hypothetical protein